MGMTDPVADMLTRIRNGIKANFFRVEVPASRLKVEVARVLRDEGYIKNYKLVKDRKQGVLRLYLKYGNNQEPAIRGLERISKPGRRVYVGVKGVKPVMSGLGICILSTSKGVLADRTARRQNVGGEVLCTIW